MVFHPALAHLLLPSTFVVSQDCFDTNDGTKNFAPNDEIAFNRYDQRLDAGVRTIALCQTEFGIGCNKDDLAYVWRHPDWDTNTLEKDVAVIFLPSAQRITPNFIRPVTLNRNPNVPVDGEDLEAFGWGFTCEPPKTLAPIVAPATAAPSPTPECIGGTDPNEIQTGILQYLTNQECGVLLEGEIITDDMLCARTDSNSGVAVGGGDSGMCNSLLLTFVLITTKDDLTPMPHSPSTAIRRATCIYLGIRRNTSSRYCQFWVCR